MNTLHLKAADVVANARQAFNAGQLQIQLEKSMERCLYSGPCAIGVSVPDDLRAAWDEEGSINMILAEGLATTDNPEALDRLQYAHDNGHIEYFETILKELENAL